MEEQVSSKDLNQIKKLLKENLALTKEVKVIVKSVKKQLLWNKIWAIFKILLIVIPIIIGFLYLPSFIGKYVDTMKSSLGIDKVESVINSVPPEYQQYLK